MHKICTSDEFPGVDIFYIQQKHKLDFQLKSCQTHSGQIKDTTPLLSQPTQTQKVPQLHDTLKIQKWTVIVTNTGHIHATSIPQTIA